MLLFRRPLGTDPTTGVVDPVKAAALKEEFLRGALPEPPAAVEAPPVAVSPRKPAAAGGNLTSCSVSPTSSTDDP